MHSTYRILALAVSLGFSAATGKTDTAGPRPYELDWAGRTADDHPALVDFEDDTPWTVDARDAVAQFAVSREQRIWGQGVGKLTYRATGSHPSIRIRPPAPLPIPMPFDTAGCWIYGNNWAWTPDPTTPQVNVNLLLRGPRGQEITVPMGRVRWKEWFLCHRRLNVQQLTLTQGGQIVFTGLEILNAHNRDDRVLYFDNVAFFKEAFLPLTFEPRPKRGVAMFPGQESGLNNGPGLLPFPTRAETILPDSAAPGSTSTLRRDGAAYCFTYRGSDGELTYRYVPRTGTWSDITAQWAGRGEAFHPLAGGGVRFTDKHGRAAEPDRHVLLDTQVVGTRVTTRWQAVTETHTNTVTYSFQLMGKSLVIDTACTGGQVAEVRYGIATGLESPRLVTLPYYDYGGSRPAIVVAGPESKPLFLSGHTDWYRSNAGTVWADNEITKRGVAYQGGARYPALTDGTRNACFERFFVTVSPRFEEVLPTIPNPVSPWKHVTGNGIWRAHGASSRERDRTHWRRVHRHGMRHVIVTDHETGWRDGGESFTFRTRPAPGKGGDKGQADYARFMQDELGFIYGPYNNFTDLAPVNAFWSTDMVSRGGDNQLQQAWARCYAPKPSRAVEACAALAPEIERKFHFSTAYCDVHTCVTPWSRTDYDARVPGAGTFAATFYAYGEIMLLQKRAWDGPVYSEGGKHAYYCGLTDGNYAQDQAYDIPRNPWLVDFDLRSLHDLCCNFGMGNLDMFYRRRPLGNTRTEIDASVDRFLAATVAFGHPGFLVFEGGFHNALRSYYMTQQLAARYTQVPVNDIRYLDADGGQHNTTAAVATGVFRRSQVLCRYADGTVTLANGHTTDPLQTTLNARAIVLPPGGYTGWTPDNAVYVFAGLVEGHRCDYAHSPEYIYLDGRGRDVRFPKAGGAGLAICRKLPDGWEVIPYQNADCGFAVQATDAMALDAEENVLGPAALRHSRGLTYVVPVAGAFSYRLRRGKRPAAVTLSCSRHGVVPGERVTVNGSHAYDRVIPVDAKPKTRVWLQVEGAWIDFVVTPVTELAASLRQTHLDVAIRSNLPSAEAATVRAAGQHQACQLVPGKTTTVTLDLGPPHGEAADLLTLEVHVANRVCRREWGMQTRAAFVALDLPDAFRSGIHPRGAEATFSLAASGGYAQRRETMRCGNVPRAGVFMHPPWRNGIVGSTFALFDPVVLPDAPPTAFRAFVGKLDGSDSGDGILYRVAVVETNGTETVVSSRHVTEHSWTPLEADLSPWASHAIRLKLIADCGEADNTSGDWAAWGQPVLQSREKQLIRRLDDDARPYRHEVGPTTRTGIALDTLRAAPRGWVHYEGKGLAGRGAHGTSAVFNGIPLGSMTPAGGNEGAGIFSASVSVALNAAAIRSLRRWNTVTIENPNEDCFSVRRFQVELELADGTRVGSDITPATFSQPGTWLHAEGVPVPHGTPLRIDIWFR